MAKDFYHLLGVSKSATTEEIKRAFRALAHEHHPDKKGGNAEKFKEINEAYQVLSDAEKRQRYDQFGAAAFEQGAGSGGFSGFPGGGFEFNMGDLGDLGGMFEGFFGGGGRRNTRPKGNDVQVDVTISFSEMVFGAEKDLSLRLQERCEACDGTGAEDKKEKTCGGCAGKGSRVQMVRTILGAMRQEAVCEDCRGSGKIPEAHCRVCQGDGVVKKAQTFSVKIPAGIEQGQAIRLRGRGEAAPHGTSGDLYLRIFVKNDPRFERDGTTIRANLHISMADAALGCTQEIAVIDGMVDLKVPSGTQSGTELRLRGQGIMSEGHRGDFVVTIFAETPTKLSRQQRELLESLRKTL